MKLRFSIIFFWAYLLTSCSSQQVDVSKHEQNTSRISLAGEWQFLPAKLSEKKAKWQTITVPANWYKEGYDIHGKAQYKRQVFIDKTLQGKRINLVLNGVDYMSDIWINQQHVGSHEGYFQTFSFDITPHLKFNAQNEIRIQVDSPLEKEEDFSLRKRLIKGIFSHHDTRPGGAWSKRGQERNTGGIWGSAELHISEDIYAERLKAIPKRLNANDWQLQTSMKLAGDLPKGTQFHWELNAKNHNGENYAGSSYSPRFNIDVKEPKLWWPRGFGEPNLYELKLKISHKDRVLDEIKTTTAFRTVELSDKKEWIINDKRILLMGTNYIATQWLSEMNRVKYSKDIRLMEDANINTIRVHAHIISPEFYEICDERGMMIWQDFPLQWGYQDTQVFHQQAMSQLEDMIEQYANHPSIIHWTLHNEPPWDADWMKWKYPDYNPKQNKHLDEKLYKRANQLEKSRPVSMYSATYEHPWLGWYSGHWLDYAKPTEQAFIAEFGSQALPDADILDKIMQGDTDLPPHSEAEQKAGWKNWEKWKYHNFQPRETFEIAKIPVGQSTNDLIKNTQQYQVGLIQLAAESYRRQAYQPVTALFQFMLVEDWESMNWGIIDYWRNTKPGYASLKRAYQPILPSLEWSKVEYPEGKVTIGLWGLNDSQKSYQQVSYKVQLLESGELIDKKSYHLDLLADDHKKIEDYLTPELKAGSYQLNAQLIDKNNTVLGTNNYAFTIKK